jgi:hypothetical protein
MSIGWAFSVAMASSALAASTLSERGIADAYGSVLIA